MSVRTTTEDETTKICKYNKKMQLLMCLMRTSGSRKSSKNRSPLHGMHHQQIENVSHRTKSYQRLDKALLTHSTEADCNVQSTLTHCNVKDPFIYFISAL